MADLPTSCGDVLIAPPASSEASVTLGKMVKSPIQLNYTARPDFHTMKNIPLPLNNSSDDKKH